MACVCVEIIGKDGKNNRMTTDAASAFDAIRKAAESWGRLWWWDSEVIATVTRGETSWHVSVRTALNETADRHIKRIQ